MSISLPKVGFGTYLITNQELEQAIPTALKAGYRHIDTAQVYRNEEGVGFALTKALEDQGLSREDVFITTKVFPGNEARGQSPMTYSDTLNSIEPSLEKLQLDYVDLYLIHAPFCKNERVEQWRALVKSKDLVKPNRLELAITIKYTLKKSNPLDYPYHRQIKSNYIHGVKKLSLYPTLTKMISQSSLLAV